MERCHVVVLGGGPAGVGAAYKLRSQRRASVTLIEQHDSCGGNAGSFVIDGVHVDFGSHRLHHATEPEVLAEIEGLLKGDLRDRPRNGHIRLRNKWVKFPLNGKDLMLRLDKAFAFSAAKDMLLGPLRKSNVTPETFASVLRAKLGPTICDHFYYPYARKLWGHEPEELSAIQAYRRVSASTFSKLLMKVIKPTGGGKFYYPRLGFGQISNAYAQAARDLGADLWLNHRVEKIVRLDDGRYRVIAKGPNGTREVEADHLWSSLPITLALRMMEPAVPSEIQAAASQVAYRAMLLVYLVLDVDQFSETDAHYFPEENVRMTRLSEPKNYYGEREPRGTTVLCAEIPCDAKEPMFGMDDTALGKMVVDDMAKVGLKLQRPPVRVLTRRLPQAYPTYLNGYEGPLNQLDAYASALPNFVSYGRQGLFAHDNTHHALFMAYSAVNCLGDDGKFDMDAWNRYREVFKTHVVED